MELFEALKQRRSINFFDADKELPDETIKELLEIANTTPSSFNLQPWEVIVVKNKEKKKLLKELAFNQPKVEEASALLIVLADEEGLEKNIDQVLDSWVDLGYMPQEQADQVKGMPANLYLEKGSINRIRFATKNAAFFAMTLMIAAKGLGLDTHPIDGILEDKIKEAFGIKEHKSVPLLIALGYKKPGFELLPRAFRRKVDDFTTFLD